MPKFIPKENSNQKFVNIIFFDICCTLSNLSIIDSCALEWRSVATRFGHGQRIDGVGESARVAFVEEQLVPDTVRNDVPRIDLEGNILADL